MQRDGELVPGDAVFLPDAEKLERQFGGLITRPAAGR
jgi:hypothetical protein